MGRAGETPASPQPLGLGTELGDSEKGREWQEVTCRSGAEHSWPSLTGEAAYRS